jgi:hypothetical protein
MSYTKHRSLFTRPVRLLFALILLFGSLLRLISPMLRALPPPILYRMRTRVPHFLRPLGHREMHNLMEIAMCTRELLRRAIR